jgi:hypothetical protein
MTRAYLTAYLGFVLLACALLPAAAEARYSVPSPSQVLGASKLILIGEVEAVESGHFVVKIAEQVVGPQQKLEGRIKVLCRPRVQRCAPQDPAGVVPGTRWVWVLSPPTKGTESYRSWTSAPFRIEEVRRAGKKIERVHYFGVMPRQIKEAPTLEVFVTMIKSYRACYQVAPSGVAKQIASAKDFAAFVASSPYAGELVRRTPRVAPKPATPALGGGR